MVYACMPKLLIPMVYACMPKLLIPMVYTCIPELGYVYLNWYT